MNDLESFVFFVAIWMVYGFISTMLYPKSYLNEHEKNGFLGQDIRELLYVVLLWPIAWWIIVSYFVDKRTSS